MNAKITIGSCKSFEDIKRTNYDWNAVADRLYDLLGEIPEAPIDRVEFIVDWKTDEEGSEENSVVHVKFKDKYVDDFDSYDWLDVPARYLFMTEREIVEDWNREQKEKEAHEKKRQQQLEAVQEQKQYQTYLRLKEVYEGTEAVNGLPEKSPNL